MISYEGDYNIIVGPHVDLEQRLEAMDKFGIDIEVLTLTTPGVEREPPERGKRLARIANDELGEIVEKHRDNFTALAVLSMRSPEDAASELERAVKDRGLRGAIIFSNVNGLPLDDARFFKVYESASELGVPLFVHPTSPINHTAMGDFRLVPILGFTVDTSLALLRFAFGGVLNRFPDLKLVAAHSGGVFPFIRGRIEKAFEAYPECREKTTQSPLSYLSKVWLDTVCYDSDVLEFALSFCTPDKTVLGTDFPHQIGDLERSVERVKSIKTLSDEDKEKILGGNAQRLPNFV